MSDILQTSTGDISIVNNSPAMVEGIQEIAQRITQRLRTFYGECFLDRTRGVKYFEEILKKNPSPILRDKILKDTILNTAGVVSLEAYAFEQNANTRTGTVSFTAKTISGNIQTEVSV